MFFHLFLLFFHPCSLALTALPMHVRRARHRQGNKPEHQQSKSALWINHTDVARSTLRTLRLIFGGNLVLVRKQYSEGLFGLLLGHFQLDAPDRVRQEPVHPYQVFVRQAGVDLGSFKSPFRQQCLAEVSKRLERHQFLLLEPIETLFLFVHTVTLLQCCALGQSGVGPEYMRKALILALSLIAILSSAEEAPSARETLAGMRQRLRSAYDKKDYPEMRQAASDIHAFLHGAPNATYDLACAAALNGDKDEAIRLLTKAIATRQSFPIEKDEDLASLRSDPRFQALVSEMKRHLEPLSTSASVARISEKDLLPEDIAYDRASDSFLLTSVLAKKIVKISRQHPEKLTVFADLSTSPGWPLFALGLDAKHSVLWIAASALPDFVPAPKADAGKSALIKLDLKSGKELARYSPPDDKQAHALGDLTILRDGTVIVSDGLRGGVYRLRPDAAELESIDARQFISPQTPAATADGKFVFIPDYTRGIGRIDLTNGQVLWLDSDDTVASNGIDGLYVSGQSLYAVQNGSNPERIVRYRLDREMRRITQMEVLESNSPGLGDPTHGIFVDHDFYFIANSGWDKLDDHGKLKSGAEFSSPEIRRLAAHPRERHIQ